ncbi:hypothetical protein ANN_06541 [Periplaneta americana]|uniref:SAC domain-containing protein n=1 Tax=Periplaneta americana TaxID=6978 RepID=A0ABQ8TDZ6_PERAM|nr:hypothetical protein ANN_06541 [Periplaneta americana]
MSSKRLMQNQTSNAATAGIGKCNQNLVIKNIDTDRGVIQPVCTSSPELFVKFVAVHRTALQETESVKKQYTKLLDAYGCLGVLQLNAGESTVLYLVLVTGCVSVGKISDSEVFRITQTSFVSLRNQSQDEERIAEVRKVLNSGTFYFSWSSSGEALDITLCAQRRRKMAATDNRFFCLLSKNLKVRIYKTVTLPVVLYGCETWTLTLREEQRLRMFENKVFRKIFGAKRDEVIGEWRKLHNAELHALYSSPDIIRNIKFRRLRWAGHVARMGESRNAYRVLVGRPEGKDLWGGRDVDEKIILKWI